THAQLKINDGFTKEIMTEMLHRIVYSFGQLIKEVEADHVFYSRIVLVKNNFERFYLALINEELFVSIESRKEDAYENIYLHVRDVNVADLLNEKLYNQKLAVIMTSATLTSQGSFSYIEQELGIRHLNVLKQQFSSPFNLQEQAKIMVTNDFPSVYDE